MTEDRYPQDSKLAAAESLGHALPVSPQVGPYVVQVKEGETYLWCSCGLSRTQPFCDGSHAGTGFEPVAFEPPLDAEFHLCGCKRSDNKPYCFGNCRGHDRWRMSP
jgi:CDGSH-type Zn-finger protein